MGNLSITKKVLILLGVCAAVFIFLNFDYFWANVNFFIRPPQSTPISISVTHSKIQPNILIIDSLDIRAPLQYPTTTGETASQAALNNGVAHYPGTANPGQVGNCYIFGHSSNYIWIKNPYKTIFATLPSIKIGADVIVSDPQGAAYAYQVTASYMVAANDTKVLSQQTGGQKILTLQTSYPVGTALARWIVVARLQE